MNSFKNVSHTVDEQSFRMFPPRMHSATPCPLLFPQWTGHPRPRQGAFSRSGPAEQSPSPSSVKKQTKKTRTNSKTQAYNCVETATLSCAVPLLSSYSNCLRPFTCAARWKRDDTQSQYSHGTVCEETPVCRADETDAKTQGISKICFPIC